MHQVDVAYRGDRIRIRGRLGALRAIEGKGSPDAAASANIWLNSRRLIGATRSFGGLIHR